MKATTKTYLRSGATLLGTLLLGILIGALLVGSVTRNRIEQISDFQSPDGFVTRLEALIQPESEEQRDQLRPILEQTGNKVAHTIDSTRTDIRQVISEMYLQLEPLLTSDQKARIQARQRLIQRGSRLLR